MKKPQRKPARAAKPKRVRLPLPVLHAELARVIAELATRIAASRVPTTELYLSMARLLIAEALELKHRKAAP